MQIVLPGALPDPAQAGALASHLTTAAPTLQRWMALGQARQLPAIAAQTGCTAHEQWRLAQHGFQPRENQNLSAGLGPLLAARHLPPDQDAAASDADTSTPDTPIWLAELVHIAPSRDGAALIPAQHLDISAQDSAALLQSALPLFDGSGFSAQPHGHTHWRITPDAPLALRCASPDLVAMSTVNDWWPQDAQGRPWRRLFNELQMLWFDHPANHARAARGLPPVNGLWLFGGACPAQLGSAPDAGADDNSQTRTYDALYDPCLRQDWGGWIAALTELEATVFAPLGYAPQLLVLTGRDRIVEIRPAARWRRWLPGAGQTWSSWWQHPA